MQSPSIFDFIKTQENSYETEQISIGDNWDWNMRDHIQLIFHLKNGVFYTGENNWMRAFKNIMEPILELSYWTEDLEVKDVEFYIEGQDDKVLSFLIKKYHDTVYVKEHNLDTLFDEITESDIDYGGVLVQKGVDRPEVLELNSIAFCDQTDLLGGALGFKFYFTPNKLRSMSKFGWGEKSNGATISLDELCILASAEKTSSGLSEKSNKVPSKTIEVYIVRGSLPEHYLKDDDNMEDYCNQLQIVAFYTDPKGNKQGVTLYRREEEEGNLKFFTSKKVYQRALGRGIGERLLHPQIWTNFLTIHKTKMLEAGSKVPLYTDDPTYTQKNKIQDMETLEITTIEEGKQIRQVPTIAPANIQLYESDINSWYMQAQNDGSAQDPLMGKEAPSGTTFKGQERSVAQGRGTHDKRRGQRAKFIEELYREFIIPDIIKEITKGKEFLATLTSEELNFVAERLAESVTEKKVKEMIFEKNKPVTKEERDMFKEALKNEIIKKGNKQLLTILKEDFKGVEVKIGINIANKQKNLADLSDKLLSVFQFVFQNPQAFMQSMQIPALAKSFENILEYSGMSIADFSSLTQPMKAPIAPSTTEAPTPSPLSLTPEPANV